MVFYVIICVIILYILIATTAYFFKLQGKDIYLDKIEINLSKHKSIKITTKAKGEPPVKNAHPEKD